MSAVGRRRRVVWPLLAAMLLSGCSAGPLKNGGMALSHGPGDLRLPVVSVSQRKFETVVRQQYDFSCGSAALATLLTHHYDDPQAEPDVFLGMWREGDRAQIRRAGFSLLDMKRYLQQSGLDGNGYRIALDDIRKTKIPGIAMIETKGYRHFVTVKGMVGGEVLIGDPAFGLRTMTLEEFARVWNGIYFVVERKGETPPQFNAARDWRGIGRGRYAVAMDPASLQAAALLSLGFQEF